MFRTQATNLQTGSTRFFRLTLILLWVMGLVAGLFLAFQADHAFFSLMRRAGSSPVSIVGLLVVFGLPFLFTALAVFISRPVLVLIPVFCKAVSIGFVCCALELALAPGGWLLRFFLLFSDLCSLPCLLWLWLRTADTGGQRFRQDALVYILLCLVIGSLDYCMVSPSLVMLLS